MPLRTGSRWVTLGLSTVLRASLLNPVGMVSGVVKPRSLSGQRPLGGEWLSTVLEALRGCMGMAERPAGFTPITYVRWGDLPNHLDHLRKVGANNRIRKDVGRYYRGPCECESGTIVCNINVSSEKDQLAETIRMGPHIILLQEHT